MTFSRMAKSGRCCLAALVLSGAASSWAAAASLRDSLGATPDDRFTARIEGRFRSEAGGDFVLDSLPGSNLTIRFDASPEVWVLHPQSSARGDVVYRNDVGDPVLRATRVGGLTLFTPERPGGVAAAFVGEGPALRLPVVPTGAALLQAATLASARAGRAAQRSITFEVEDAPIPSWSLIADAALVAAQAFQQVASNHDLSRNLGGWKRVELVAGKSASVSAQEGGTLRITVDPSKGFAGRPSSLKMAELLAKPAKR